jgi:hypothetical protein
MGCLLVSLTSCIEESEPDVVGTPGTLSLYLSSGSMAQSTRDGGDPEFYMGKVYFFFYKLDAGEDEAPLYVLSNNVDTYNNKELSIVISDYVAGELFGTGSECTLYAVANMPEDIDLSDYSQLTREKLKKMVPVTIVNCQAPKEGLYAMDGECTVTRNADTSLSGTLVLERSLAKITLNLQVAKEFTTADGTTTYESQDKSGKAKLVNSVSTGILNGVDENRTFAEKYSFEYNTAGVEGSYTSGDVEVPCRIYKHDALYTYPNEWSSDFDSKETSFTLSVGWKKKNATEFTTYYYQLPVNLDGTKLQRNHHYIITLKVGMLGSTEEENAIELTYPYVGYEILPWGNDSKAITATLSKTHYLVALDKEFTLWNVSDLSVIFNSCTDDVKAYLTEVSYYSTKLDKDIYLFKSSYDDKGTYTYLKDDDNYTSDDVSMRTDHKDVLTYLVDNKDNIAQVSLENTTEESSSSSAGSTGYLKFNADVAKTAALLYRPVVYTIVLVNGKDHNYLRTTIKITQYPAQYVEFGEGDNVFVNGYYARLTRSSDDSKSGTSSWTLDDVTYYKSYPFLYTSYSGTSGTTNGISYDGYYYASNDNVLKFGEIDYGRNTNTENRNADIVNFYAINTSYEYLQGSVQTNVSFQKTLDVYVSAFSTENNFFSVTTSTGTDKKYYVLGDPRVVGGFKKSDHSNSSYRTTTYDNNFNVEPKYDDFLYDYYVAGGTYTSYGTTYYRRYVKSWGEDAEKIKVGGKSTEYDNIIAPIYKIQSGYGALVDASYFDVAQKRCATYQEAGYPAGRWRLPTLAEIAFVVSLQKAKAIDPLFVQYSTGYWTSSGYYYAYLQDGTTEYKKPAAAVNSGTKATIRHWVRCVYDLWYWQDGDKDTHQFKPTDVYYPYPELK